MKISAQAVVVVSIVLTLSQSIFAANEAEVRLNKIRKLMDDAASGKNLDITYIVSGDSTRDSDVAGQEYIYNKMLSEVNIKYIHNARSGLRAYQWLRNSVPASSLQKAIDNSADDGENTIMEFSLGINDKNAFSRAGTKTNIMSCITAYLAAKPKANLFLVVPVTHQTSFQEEWLILYKEIADELKLPLINQERIMYDAFYDEYDRFYYDNTHPNYFGALRLTRYILETISGPLAKSKMMWSSELFTGSRKTGDENLSAGKKIIKNSWYWPHNESPALKGGSAQQSPVMNRLEPFAVNENSLLKISGVNVYKASMINPEGKLIYTFAASEWKNHGIQYIYVPYGIIEARLTLKSSNDDKDTPIIKYFKTGALAEFTASDLYYKK